MGSSRNPVVDKLLAKLNYIDKKEDHPHAKYYYAQERIHLCITHYSHFLPYLLFRVVSDKSRICKKTGLTT